MSETKNSERDWKAGDWFLAEYGFGFHKFYITEIVGKRIFVTRPSWCVSSATTFTRERLNDADYIGRGELKWYWKYLPWRDVIPKFKYPSAGEES